MKSRVYLAGSYATKGTMKKYRDELATMGYTVTSRWIDQTGEHEKGDLSPDRYMTTPDECYEFAERDMDDIAQSDVFIMFTGDGLGSGGRHTELGLALTCTTVQMIVIIGPRENVFQCNPAFIQFDNWGDFVNAVWEGISISQSGFYVQQALSKLVAADPFMYGTEPDSIYKTYNPRPSEEKEDDDGKR